MFKMLKGFLSIKRWFFSINHKDIGILAFLIAILMIYDDNLFIDTINLLVCSANFAFTIVLVIIGVFLALLDSLGVTVETDFIVNFILFLLAQSRLFILCRIFVSLYNSYLSNKLREYLLSVNFYILLVFLCICW
jgi:hypothetical protein